MIGKWVNLAIVTMIVVVLSWTAALAQDERKPRSIGQVGAGAPTDAAAQMKQLPRDEEQQQKSKGMAALEHAAAAEKYLFAFFYKDKDEQTRGMREVFDGAMRKAADRAESVAVDVADPQEKAFVNRFRASRAPLPLVLALAPNGAITGGFPRKFDESRLLNAFATPCMEKCLKALQSRKLTLLCVQNESTKHNDEAMQGVREFMADARYGRTTEVITLDPRDPQEVTTLRRFRIDPETDEAITVVLASPGRVVGTFIGETDKDKLVAAVRNAVSGCDTRSGCCPKKKPAGQPAAKKPTSGGQDKKAP